MITIKTVHTAFNTLRANFTSLEDQLLALGFVLDDYAELVEPDVIEDTQRQLVDVLLNEYAALREAIDDFTRMIVVQQSYAAHPGYQLTHAQTRAVHRIVGQDLERTIEQPRETYTRAHRLYVKQLHTERLLAVIEKQLTLPAHYFAKGYHA